MAKAKRSARQPRKAKLALGKATIRELAPRGGGKVKGGVKYSSPCKV